MSPSACPPGPTDNPRQNRCKINEAKGSSTTPGPRSGPARIAAAHVHKRDKPASYDWEVNAKRAQAYHISVPAATVVLATEPSCAFKSSQITPTPPAEQGIPRLPVRHPE